MSGLHLALMGVDGAGKSTIAVEVAQLLRAEGRPVEIVSFKRAMAGTYPVPSSILGTSRTRPRCASTPTRSRPTPAVDLAALLPETDPARLFPAMSSGGCGRPIERNAARPFLSSACSKPR